MDDRVSMARPLRVRFPGAVYRVTVRGNERKPISRDARVAGAFWSAWRPSCATGDAVTSA